MGNDYKISLKFKNAHNKITYFYSRRYETDLVFVNTQRDRLEKIFKYIQISAILIIDSTYEILYIYKCIVLITSFHINYVFYDEINLQDMVPL